MKSDRAIIFDLDGTLTDPFDGITRSIRHALEAIGVESPSPEELACWIGPPLRLAFGALLATNDAETIERAVALYRERYLAVGYLENIPYPGIDELLRRLRQEGAMLYVVTSKMQPLATLILEHFALAHHFTAIYGAEPGGRLDDKAVLLAEMLDAERIAPANAVMVGDTRFDLIAATACGLRGVAVTYGYGTVDDLAAHAPSAICASPAELADSLLSLFEKAKPGD
jgi:phosphoglycolate phosphatase